MAQRESASRLQQTGISPRTPVVIGVGEFLYRNGADDPQGAAPIELARRAIEVACQDAGLSTAALRQLSTIAVVPIVTWRYENPGVILKEHFDASQAQTWYGVIGGNSPQRMVNRAAASIAAGTDDFVVVCGAEAGRARKGARKHEITLDWQKQSGVEAPDWFDESEMFRSTPLELELAIAMPTSVYPLFESVLWHRSGRSREEHLNVIGQLWADYSAAAAKNPLAWNATEYSATEILTPTPENRMVASPYTKHMVANPDVDMAAAVIITSYEKAQQLGVPADHLVFLHAGTDGEDQPVATRIELDASPAMAVAGTRVFELSGLTPNDIDYAEVYSCFPSAVQIAVNAFGLDPTCPLTVSGGLPFAGAPWNNPVTHSIAQMVHVLRENPSSFGLITANGGNIDKHAFGIYSTSPPQQPFVWESPQDDIDSRGKRGFDPTFVGEAEMESWTVTFDRDGNPERAHGTCITPNGDRTFMISHDEDDIAAALTDDLFGRPVSVSGEHHFKLLNN